MKLSVFISSAVESQEKECVKKKLEDIKNLYSPHIDFDIYDCAEHGTTWSTFSKQDIIDHKIPFVDWFVCLIPEWTVGKKTWEELEHILKLHKDGFPVVISVFHPNECLQADKTAVPEGMVTFDFIMEESKKILGNDKDQYWVDYKYGDKENLTKTLFDQFKTLYFTDKAFRIQRLDRFAKFGHEIKAKDIYFDPERADIVNGFKENKYFPRKSVDGRLKTVLIDEQLKFIILNGAPGSGKTRALYQLLVPPTRWALDNNKQYALGALSETKVIVVKSDNVLQVYDFLKSENEYDFSMQPSCEYYLVCDQLKNVFDNRMSDNDVYNFFDIVSQKKHIHMIATSIPSAYEKFCARWDGYGCKPLNNDQLTKVITIPQVSSDDEGESIRMWMWNELKGNSAAETIGDFIPELNNYKKGIVERLYHNKNSMPYLSHFLSALQIIETFRNDTALFLPVLFMSKNIDGFDKKKTIEVINYLIDNNVIWVRKKSADGQAQEVILRMQEKDFRMKYSPDCSNNKKDNFKFDNEIFEETNLSTAYTYDVNEIIWDEIEREDRIRRNQSKDTLLRDFNDVWDVEDVAIEFERAFPLVSSLRRILPRIPHTDCYKEASEEIWGFVYNKLRSKDNSSIDKEMEEFLTTVGMLIGRSQDIGQIKIAINILQEKNQYPNYGIIGELYSAGLRMGKKDDIEKIVEEIRNTYHIQGESFFSMERKIGFYGLSFYDALKEIENDNFLTLNNATKENKDKFEIFNIERLIYSLAKRGDTIEQWEKVFELHRKLKINIRRSLISTFFSVVSVYDKRLRKDKKSSPSEDILYSSLNSLYFDYGDIIADEDKESCFFYAIDASCNFNQSYSVYQLYVKIFGNDNQRLISMVLRSVLNHEYQKALLFLIDTNQKFKNKGCELNDICFNNLIKSAPNMGEALDVVPYMNNVQDYTLSNILSLLKNKRFIEDVSSITGTKQDPKIFYYAYSVVMRKEFTALRKSPYIICLLYDLATTPKHERFIREKLLEGLEEIKKCEIIDYSTIITSIRMKKNYRTLDEVWDIFNRCRDHYKDEKLFIKSELYSNMIMKLKFLCKTDEFKKHQDKLIRIILEDYNRIIRDEYFIPSLYRFLPEKKVVDDNGNICADFKKEMVDLNLSVIRPLNAIMAELKTEGFDIVWKFYEFIVDYYHEKGKRKSLRPDIRTITYLMETIETKEQFECVEKTSEKWGLDALLRRNKIYSDIRKSKRQELGLCSENDNKRTGHDNVDKDLRTNEEKINLIIKLIEEDIHLYGRVTPTRFNQHLRTICDVVKNIKGDKSLKSKMSTIDTYTNLLFDLLNKYGDKICYNALSYVYLIKLSPESNVDRWRQELKNKKEIYQYDFVACAAIAQSNEICDKDVDLSLEYYKYWETITNDIGYDPKDSESFSDVTHITNFKGIKDYDGYWLTRYAHCKCEMNYYYNHLKYDKDNVKRKQILGSVKQQLDFFERFGIHEPQITINRDFFDFKREIVSENL